VALLACSAAQACAPAESRRAVTASDGLVFIRVVDGSPEVMRLRLADGAEQAVTHTPSRSERWPYWSSEAGRLLFQISTTEAPLDSDLVLWDPESTREIRFPPTPHRQERWPCWSPRGDRIAYAFRGGRPASGVVLVDIEGNAQRIIARAEGRDFFLRPSFAPDGSRLVAQRRTPRSGRSNLWLLSASAAPRPITEDPRWDDTKAWFTRDGRRIVFSRRPAVGGTGDVMSVGTDGSDLRTVVGTAANEHSAKPSPTRDEIVFVSTRDGSSDIFLANLDGSGLRSLTPHDPRDLLAPRWSPDGERIVATVIPRGSAHEGRGADASLEGIRLVVLDRAGIPIAETAGAMADWMPPWP